MTGNWDMIRKQHNPMIISMIIRTKAIRLNSQYILNARGKREIGLMTKQPRKYELSNDNTKCNWCKFTKAETSFGLELEQIVSNILTILEIQYNTKL